MWSEETARLIDKFHEVRATEQARLDARPDLSPAVFARYDDLALEMVEGIRSLLFRLIGDQVYIRKHYPHMDQGLYRDMHVVMMDGIHAALDPEVDTLPEFYFRLLTVIDGMSGYCTLLRQDIAAAFRRYPHLQRDRRFRQTNLQVKQAREGFGRLKRHCTALSRLIGGEQAGAALSGVLETDGSKAEIMALLRSGTFTDAEKQALEQLLEME